MRLSTTSTYGNVVVNRAVELRMGFPSAEQLYGGPRSIYSAVFDDTVDFTLKMRFAAEESGYGYPHLLTTEGLAAINRFAEAELTAMVVHGTGTGNTSLPLTDTQTQRLKGEKEAAKQRAAAARQRNPSTGAVGAGGGGSTPPGAPTTPEVKVPRKARGCPRQRLAGQHHVLAGLPRAFALGASRAITSTPAFLPIVRMGVW